MGLMNDTSDQALEKRQGYIIIHGYRLVNILEKGEIQQEQDEQFVGYFKHKQQQQHVELDEQDFSFIKAFSDKYPKSCFGLFTSTLNDPSTHDYNFAFWNMKNPTNLYFCYYHCTYVRTRQITFRLFVYTGGNCSYPLLDLNGTISTTFPTVGVCGLQINKGEHIRTFGDVILVHEKENSHEGSVESSKLTHTRLNFRFITKVFSYLNFYRRYGENGIIWKRRGRSGTCRLRQKCQNINGEIDQAREIFEAQTHRYIDNKFFWINYINFELGFYGEEAEARIRAAFEKAREHLPLNAKKEITTRYREYLLERGQTVNLLNRVPSTTISEISSLLEPSPVPPPATAAVDTAGMKRSAPDDNSANYHYSKQARFDNTQQQQQPYFNNSNPQQGGGYGFQQQQPFGNEYYAAQPGNWQS
ncbi:hypothetical protein K501DRAFT_331910 [Backusella circina FSU 941]|nr:hypothetical protein K501DRAFT_331910 [Backusella circina FSU 941]